MLHWNYKARSQEVQPMLYGSQKRFGKNGDGWFRLTAFGTHENTVEAMQRVKKLLSK